MWFILVIVYIIWNVCAYSASSIFGTNTILYDYSYWINERIFVVIAFLALLKPPPERYRWVIKVLIVVASWKLLYILLLVGGIIEKNDKLSLWVMSTLFTGSLIYMYLAWDRKSKIGET